MNLQRTVSVAAEDVMLCECDIGRALGRLVTELKVTNIGAQIIGL
jgi:hypothetical protein